MSIAHVCRVVFAATAAAVTVEAALAWIPGKDWP